MVDKFTNRWSQEVCWRGIVVKPGQTVTDEGKKTKDKEIKEKDKTNNSDEIEKLRTKLNKMKMKELRVIGKEYDVYDTKKSELADEIINAKIQRGEI
jgi:magnesium-transporting ATPase (P-type)